MTGPELVELIAALKDEASFAQAVERVVWMAWVGVSFATLLMVGGAAVAAFVRDPWGDRGFPICAGVLMMFLGSALLFLGVLPDLMWPEVAAIKSFIK